MKLFWIAATVLGGGFVAYRMVKIPGVAGSGQGIGGMPAVNQPGGILSGLGTASTGVNAQTQVDWEGKALNTLAQNSPDLVRAIGEGFGGIFGGGGDQGGGGYGGGQYYNDDSFYGGQQSGGYAGAQPASYDGGYGGGGLYGSGDVAYNDWRDGGGGSDYDPYYNEYPVDTYA